MPRWLLAASAAVAVAAPSPAADNPHVWDPKVKTVAVFKNGFGFFVREGEVKLRDGWAVTANVPPAVLGTLAVYTHNEADTVDVVGVGPGEQVEFDGKDSPKEPAAVRARLDAVKGLKVQLGYTTKGADRTAAGLLASVGPDFAVLDVEGGNALAVPLDGLKKLQLLEQPVRLHVAREKPAADPVKLGMAYLRQGVTWVPEYTVKVIDDGTAEVTLRGTLVNEAEDLIHTDVQFVVGVPHFVHGNYLEPVAVGQAIRTVGAALAPAGVQSQLMLSNAMISNSVRNPEGDPRVLPPADPGKAVKAAVGDLPPLDAPGAASDFTVYTKPDLTVRRGEKAVVTLFRKKVKYTHRYKWDSPGDIAHSLLLWNDTDSPFTTGPFVAVSGTRPLAQDILKYTPKGGASEVPLTTAVNVAVDREEAEVDRKIKSLTDATRARNFDLVTLKGTLRVRNFEKKPIEIAVSVHVPGKPLEASDGGTATTSADKLVLTEREGKAAWKLTVEPGATKQVEYKYERYVPTP